MRACGEWAEWLSLRPGPLPFVSPVATALTMITTGTTSMTGERGRGVPRHEQPSWKCAERLLVQPIQSSKWNLSPEMQTGICPRLLRKFVAELGLEPNSADAHARVPHPMLSPTLWLPFFLLNLG